MDIKKAIEKTELELLKANRKFPNFNSTHEGYAVMLEELDELWCEIKKNSSPELLCSEAVQVSAMAIKFMMCFCGDE